MRKILKIILHCSDSPDEQDIGFDEIDSWHKARGFEYRENGQSIHCGYHYIVRRDGTIERGRPEYAVGAHCHGHNEDSIGIVWVGRDEMTDLQKRHLVTLCDYMLCFHALDESALFQHCDFNNKKTCPRFLSEKTFRSIEEFRSIVRDSRLFNKPYGG